MTVRELLDNIELQSEAVFCYYDYFKEERVVITEHQASDFDIKYMYTDVDKKVDEMKIFIEVSVEEGDEMPEDKPDDKMFDLVMVENRGANIYATLDNRTGHHLYVTLSSGRTIEIPSDGVTVMTYSEEDVAAVNLIAYDGYTVEY